MRLGTQTASLVNHIQAHATLGQPDPKPGMGATILMWTDRRPATVFRVFEHRGMKAIEVRDDDYKLVSGSTQSESQEYEFKTRVNGRRTYFVFDGSVWREAVYKVKSYAADGTPVRSNSLSIPRGGHGLRLGQRDAYYDPSF